MTKSLQLVVMRHGEAEGAGGANGGRDHARRLTARGILQAEEMGRLLAARSVRPCLGLASDSVRTQATAQAVSRTIKVDIPWIATSALYLADVRALCTLLGELDQKACRTVLVVGHNPGFSDAASALSSEVVSLDTGQAVLLHLSAASWAEGVRARGQWELVDHLSPPV